MMKQSIEDDEDWRLVAAGVDNSFAGLDHTFLSGKKSPKFVPITATPYHTFCFTCICFDLTGILSLKGDPSTDTIFFC